MNARAAVLIVAATLAVVAAGAYALAPAGLARYVNGLPVRSRLVLAWRVARGRL